VQGKTQFTAQQMVASLGLAAHDHLAQTCGTVFHSQTLFTGGLWDDLRAMMD
jgi:hypothetical protein